jgi:ketosteroid isomerase-like protein
VAFTQAEEAALRQLMNELGVRKAVEGYFHAVDAYDWDLCAELFTEDAVFEFNANTDHKTVIEGGRSKIMPYFRDRNSLFKAKTHRISHLHIKINGDTAECDTFGVSNVVFQDNRMAVRGIRYADSLVRGQDGVWRFRKRVHSVGWQHFAEPVPPEVPHVTKP